MRNIKTIEESIEYFKKKIFELPDNPFDQEARRLERIFNRRVEVLEEYKREMLDY